MIDEKEKNNYKVHITGIKGFACLMIMVCHFIGIYKYAQSFPISIGIADKILNSSMRILLDEGYWLYCFFVISGYLLSQKEIVTIRELLKRVFLRFLRFALPIMFAYFVIYLLYLFVGFFNSETIDVFTNYWYQGYYHGDYSIRDVILSPVKVIFQKEPVLNEPYWCLKSMFVGSVLLYGILFVCSRIVKNVRIVYWITIVVAGICFLLNTIIFALIVGFIVAWMEKEGRTIIKCQDFAFTMIILAFFIHIMPEQFWKSFFFAIVIFFMPRTKLICNIMSSKVFEFLGKISWGIYSFHWPIICSFGALIIINMSSKSMVFAYTFSFFFVIVCTILVSTLFYFSFEKWSDKICKTIDKRMSKLM